METTLHGNGFDYTFNEDGTWIYKAVPFKKVEKKKESDKPQIKAIYKIEENYLEHFNKTCNLIAKDISKYLG